MNPPQPAPRIAIEGSSVVGSRSGVGNAAAHLLNALAQCWPENWPPGTIFVNSPRHPLPENDPWMHAPCFNVRRTRYSGRALLRGWQYLNWPPAQKLAGPMDLLHSPAAYVVPARRALRVITIHDLYCLDRLDHVQTYGGAYFAATYPRKLAGVDAIIAISDFTRRELERQLNLDPARITVIHHGVDLDQFVETPDSSDAPLLHALRLTGPYILLVGTIEPRKNLPTMLDAYALLHENMIRAGATPPLLAVAGMPGWGKQEFEDKLHAMGRAGARVRRLGYVAQRELAALYRGASAYCFPSVYEGFGLPLLEAMACGCPVVSSDTAAMPEIGGDAALYASPHDAEAWTAQLERLLNSPNEAAHRRQMGLTRVAQFTWGATARSTLALYRRVLAARNRPG